MAESWRLGLLVVIRFMPWETVGIPEGKSPIKQLSAVVGPVPVVLNG